ncbi:unnamed protein product [Dovyalis caffra]|uniref:Uncharacterized protein n=1 Tax=Dovyalis caffra TaxID=77055 RepID=A0AAV1SGN1_9ROSI|nr:unnamed protein product [Dovyalis caffra]
MNFQKEHLDLVLVPCGLMIMMAYHLILLYRCLHLPHTTTPGFENNDKRAWVERIMQATLSLSPLIFCCDLIPTQAHNNDVDSTALAVIASNTSAATFLASVCLTLGTLIGAWLGNSSKSVFQSKLIFGDTSESTIFIKYITLLACFFLAFSCFVQSTRHFVHANYLISMPDSHIPVKNAEKAVIRGSDCWSLGLRALYFALNLLLWFFGPIPMFVSSVIMVIILYCLDTNWTPLHEHRPLGNKVV